MYCDDTVTGHPFYFSARTTAEAVTSMPLLDANVPRLPSLEVQAEAITNIATLTVQSGGVTNVPSLQVKTESIQKVSSLQIAKGTVTKVSSLQAVSTPSPETKTEAVSTTGPTVSSPIQRSPDAGVSQAASFVATQTVGKLSIPSVTGTGSVTATPTVYTTAITTTASTTTMTTTSSGQEGAASSLLGKRVRRQSTKYEDYEQQSLIVCPYI